MPSTKLYKPYRSLRIDLKITLSIGIITLYPVFVNTLLQYFYNKIAPTDYSAGAFIIHSFHFLKVPVQLSLLLLFQGQYTFFHECFGLYYRKASE